MEEILPEDSDLKSREWSEISFGEFDEFPVEEQALVLQSRGIPFRLRSIGWEHRLQVPPEMRDTAEFELRLYLEENRDWPFVPSAPSPGRLSNGPVNAGILLLLAAFHHLTLRDVPLLGIQSSEWTSRGAADAFWILTGQWWRVVTALTLHADGLHLLGNLLIGGPVIILLCGYFGSGLGWSLILLSGILGNYVNALVQLPPHIAVGASTAVFGALGVLAGFSAVRRSGSGLLRRLLPLGAAAALLAFLGTGEGRVDIGAHLFGLLAGIGLGMGAGWGVERFGRPGTALNFALGTAAFLVPVLCWWMAFSWGK